MTNSKFVQITKDQNGREAIMVRVDKTLKEIMEEKPVSRWSVDYWHPKYEQIMSVLNRFEVKPLGAFISGTVSGHRGKTEYIEKGGVRNIEAVSMLASGTGIDPYLSREVKIGGVFDSESRRTRVGDLLFARSGVGTAGRSALVTNTSKNLVIGGHIIKVELNKKLPPEYIQVYLKTSFGWEMLDRVRAGVGALVLDKDDIETIPIPMLSDGIIKNIKSQFSEVMKYHDNAMEGKKKSDESAYKKNIETAEKMLKDLIARTEAVVRGEQKDVM